MMFKENKLPKKAGLCRLQWEVRWMLPGAGDHSWAEEPWMGFGFWLHLGSCWSGSTAAAPVMGRLTSTSQVVFLYLSFFFLFFFSRRC